MFHFSRRLNWDIDDSKSGTSSDSSDASEPKKEIKHDRSDKPTPRAADANNKKKQVDEDLLKPVKSIKKEYKEGIS